MNRNNKLVFGLGLVLIVISLFQISGAQRNIKVVNLPGKNPPVTIIAPADALPASRPTVLIAHGFAGSAVLMRGFALTLAHAGYTTISWDFEGHGGNPNPLVSTLGSSDLIRDTESALAAADASGLIDMQRIAILGHSMGSGVALEYGSRHADTYATIAISPIAQPVTSTLPKNLLLMAGSLEPQFASSAENLLASAGGQNSDFNSGRARKLIIVPNVEHISILFSPTAQQSARVWLDEVFGVQQGADDYTDRRILWFGLGIIGFILLSRAVVSSLPSTSGEKDRQASIWLRLAALIIGSLAATGILWLVSKLGVNLSQLMGILVGGYLLIWYAVAGVISLIILRPHIYRPKSMELLKGLVALAALWLGVGLIGNFVWLPWLLIPQRLMLWVPGSILLLPWFYATGEAAKQANKLGQAGWWLVQVIAIIAGLYLALTLNPEIGFIFIILPLVPVITGLHMLAISSTKGRWAYALPGALFTAWLLLAVFPLQ